MAAAFITLTTPRSMAAEQATAWLELRAGQLRRTKAVEEVTVRELRPRQRDPLWLVHVVLGLDGSGDWDRLLGELVIDLRRLGMQPTVVIDERTREATAITHSELQPA